METEAFVDLLRNTLVRHGHIVPAKHQSKAESFLGSYKELPKLLQQGEYLVSVMSRDTTLFILFALLEGFDHCDRVNAGVHEYSTDEGISFAGEMGESFDQYVNLIKMVYLASGAQAAGILTSNYGFANFRDLSLSSREHWVDLMVSKVYTDLRASGATHRELSEFFQDNELAKACYDSWIQKRRSQC